MRAYAPNAYAPKGSSRIVAAALSLALQFGVIAVLVYGLAPKFVARAVETFTTVSLDPPPTPPPPPPPPPPPAPASAHAASGKSAPANSRAKAAEVLAAPRPIPVPVPIRAAVIPAIGSADHSGAAPVAGLGTGAGGAGNGTGSGSFGNGDGDGGDDAEWTGGRITDRDVPKSARDALRQGGTTSVLISVSDSGRATGCRLTRSSGSGELDATACRLILQRFRFRPATDRSGNRIAGQIEYDQEWVRSGEWDGRGEPPPD